MMVTNSLHSVSCPTPQGQFPKPPRQLTAHVGSPGRLTRRLFTSFHSATLHFVKTAEQANTPASASPGLALETLAGSLASAAGPLAPINWHPTPKSANLSNELNRILSSNFYSYATDHHRLTL